MISARHLGVVLVPVALLALSGCARPLGDGGARSSASQRAMTACRQSADDAYLRQNRAEIYRADQYAGGGRDAPFGAASAGANPSAGLSNRYARETMLDDCLNGAADQPGTTPQAPPPTDDTAPARR